MMMPEMKLLKMAWSPNPSPTPMAPASTAKRVVGMPRKLNASITPTSRARTGEPRDGVDGGAGANLALLGVAMERAGIALDSSQTTTSVSAAAITPPT